MKVKAMNLAWISAKDSNRSMEFFTKILGLKLDSATPEHGWYELKGQEGGVCLGIGQATSGEYKSPLGVGQNAALTFSVDNIEAAEQWLKQHDVHCLGGIVEIPGHVKMLTFQDLDGNIMQLVQVLEP